MDELYVIARRVLLDALDALGAHRDAMILVGAQAIPAAGDDDARPVFETVPQGRDDRRVRVLRYLTRGRDRRRV